jgi:peptide/nickel transport system substrate-binding protein
VFNKKEGLASNVYFRQAVNAAINCDDVLASIYGTQWSLGSCYMDDTQPFWASDAGSEHYNRQDLNLVKELLAKANYKGEPFRILSNNVGASERGVLVFEQNLKAAGINVVTDIVDWATMMSYRTDSTRYDIYTTSFVSVPVPSLKLYFGSAYPGWTDDPTLAKYFEDFNAAPTREEAKRRWDILQGYSWEYLPLINVGHFNYTHAWNEKVENVTAFGGLYFWNTSVRK